MILVWLAFASLVLVRGNAGLFCRSVTPHDALCHINGTVYILSARPCQTKEYIKFTMLRTGSNGFNKSYEIEKTFDNPIQVGNGTYGVVLQIDNVKRNVTLKSVAMFKNGTQNGKDFQDVITMQFSPRPEKCRRQYYNKEKVSMANLSNCTTPLGSFSSLCFKKMEAIYLSFVNVCDFPYSVTIFVIDTALSVEVMEKLTRIHEKSYLAVKVPDTLGEECGVKLKVFSTNSFPYQMLDVEITRFCQNTPNDNNEILIKSSHKTAFGMMCEPHICKQKKPNEFQRSILNAFPDDKHGLHNFTIDIELDICDETLYKCNIALVNTTSHVLYTDVLTYGRENKSVHFINYYTNLTVFKEAEKNLYTILVFFKQRYDNITSAALRQDFYLTRDTCSTSSSSRSNLVLEIVVPIVVVLLLALAIFFCCKKWRKRRSQHYGQGLPYNIELGDDDFDFDNLGT